MSLAAVIRDRALELGFVAAGVGPATPLAREEAVLRERIGAGLMQGLDYFNAERPRLTRPEVLLPGARSVISLALPAARAAGDDDGGPGRGRVARYAWGRDYHLLARERLDALVAYIGQVAPGAACRAFVDATPLLERGLAARGGLGWVGKNNCLYVPGYGSWVALAEVVTTAKLELDAPEPPDKCGGCRRCLDACPTGALIAPRVHRVDRCLSYLTTELKGFIPRHLRPLLGDRLLGCDACQEACPHNRRVAATAGAENAEGTGLGARLDLPPLFALSEEGFRARFAGTAAARPKRRGLLRNAAVVLGNGGDRRNVLVLAEALADPEALVRGHAAWALGRLGGRQARHALEDALRREGDDAVREEIVAALEGGG